MIKFNELRVDIESNSLIIDISVADNDYYSDIYIDNICVSTQEDYSDTYSGKSVWSPTAGRSYKNIRIVETFEDLKSIYGVKLYGDYVKDNIFFIKVHTTGELLSGSPYKSKPDYIQGITFSVESIYNTMMQFIKKVEKEGVVSKDFIDYFMKYEALRVSIDTGHHSATVNLFNKFFKGKLDSPLITTQCIYG